MNTLLRGQVTQLAPGTVFALDATLGSKTIADAVLVFNSIEPEFEELPPEQRRALFRAQTAVVYEQAASAEMRNIYESFGEVGDLVLSQHQIVCFCEKHREWMCRGDFTTCFLFEANGEFFVCEVHPYDDNLDALLHRFLFTQLYFNRNVQRRFVVPQIP